MCSRKLTDTLDITNPKLLKEWDYEENNKKGIFPEATTRAYNRKVAWVCSKNHHWEASVMVRTRKLNPTGCPVCAGQKVVLGVNDFASQCKELMKEWDFELNEKEGIVPTKLTAHSGKRVHWSCQLCGHKWITAINNRTNNKRGCPNCTLKSTSFSEQALYYYVKKLFPKAINRYKELGFELDIYIPELNTGIESDGYFYHNDSASLKRDTKKYEKCKAHGIRLIRLYDSMAGERRTADISIGLTNIDNLENLNKAIRILLAELDSASNKWTRRNPLQFWSTIDQEIDVEKDYYDILGDKRLRAVENSFGKEMPELLEDWDYEANGNVNPLSLTSGTAYPANWKCKTCGYTWTSSIKDRMRGTGCPCCNRRVLVTGVNDFATLYSYALEEWDYETNTIPPEQVIAYNKKYWWKCKVCGHSWEATITDRFTRKEKTGCPKCSYKARAIKAHRTRVPKCGWLFEKFPQLLKYWDYQKNVDVDPLKVASGSNTKYWWKCKTCGLEWESSPGKRSRKYGCKKCKDRIGGLIEKTQI